MAMVQVSQDLRDAVREAMQQPYRFERTERYVMKQLLLGAGANRLVEQTFVDKARKALRRHGLASGDWTDNGHSDVEYSPDAVRMVIAAYSDASVPFGRDPDAVIELNTV